jgi:sugar lactone lactonase YvrE
MDSRGRLFVGDRGNNRIKIFDQDGKLLGHVVSVQPPSGIFIDAQDNIYVADFGVRLGLSSTPTGSAGIRIGSARTAR